MERLREKRELIRQVNHCPSSESDQVRALKQRLRATQEAEQREQVTQRLLEEANHHCEDAERRCQETEQHAFESERRVQELITEIDQLRGNLHRTESRAQLVEQH